MSEFQEFLFVGVLIAVGLWMFLKLLKWTIIEAIVEAKLIEEDRFEDEVRRG